MIRLFDILNGTVIPTEHCFTNKSLKDIMMEYPTNYLNIYAYLFYMTSANEDLNPYFNVPEHEKEEMILSEIDADFSTEDPLVQQGLKFCEKMFQTPTYRAYMGIKKMLERLGVYMENTAITHGRDGNINSLINAAAKYDQIRQSYKGTLRDLQEEQQSQVRGGQNLAYDQ